MSANNFCPVCHSPVAADRIAAEFDIDGIPYAASLVSGLGIPVMRNRFFDVKLDGKPVKMCIAFDRRAGKVWRYPTPPDGKFIINGFDEPVIQQLCGSITVQHHYYVGARQHDDNAK